MTRTALAVLVALVACDAPTSVELMPPGSSPNERLPLIIALHGRGADAAKFAPFVQRLSPRARIVAFRAPDPFPSGGFSWFPYTLGIDQVELRGSVASQASRLAALIADAARARPTCGAPIVVGYSQGGALALALAAQGAPIAAAIDLSGALPPGQPIAAVTPPVHGFHGTADVTVPYQAAQATFARGPSDGGWSLSAYTGAGHDPTKVMLADVRAAIALEVQRACRDASNDAGTK